MNKVPIIIGVSIALLLAALIAYFAYNQEQTFQWYPSYRQDGDQPYDLGMLKRQLQNNYKMRAFEKRLSEELPANAAAERSAYLFIGEVPYYTTAEAEQLLDFVRKGGSAFIATNKLPDSLIQFLIFGEQCNEDYSDFWRGDFVQQYREIARFRFEHPQLNTRKYEFAFENGLSMFGNAWNYIESRRLCDAADYPMSTLGLIETDHGESPNFVRMRVGEGQVFFHANPILFTNFFYNNPNGFEYLTKVFAHLNSETLYWDRASSVAPLDRPFERPRNNFSTQRNPMQYIYGQQSLRWAWYLFLLLGGVYVLFRAKRRQRIVPILEPNRNTSLEFVQTIGRLYYQQQDHRSILLKQMQLFLSHLRQRYHIVLRDQDESPIQRIAIRTAVSVPTIEAIFKEYDMIKKKLEDKEVQVSASTLNRFYLLIEKFHQEEAEKSKSLAKAK